MGKNRGGCSSAYISDENNAISLKDFLNRNEDDNGPTEDPFTQC